MPDEAWNPYKSINWHDAVPKEKRQLIEVWKPKPAIPVNAVILSEGLTGVFIHWLGSRSGPCLAQGDAKCPFCVIDVPRRWEGYLAGFSERTGKKYLIHVSKEAARSCSFLSDGKANLRGSRVIIERTGRAANSPCRARIEPITSLKGMIPAAFDVRAQLMCLWEGKGGLAAMMASCQSIDEAREMFARETGYDK